MIGCTCSGNAFLAEVGQLLAYLRFQAQANDGIVLEAGSALGSTVDAYFAGKANAFKVAADALERRIDTERAREMAEDAARAAAQEGGPF